MSTRDTILGLRKDKSSMELFETADVEEGHQETQLQVPKSLSDRKKSEDVVHLDLKPTLAFAKFAGKIYDPVKPDTTSTQIQSRVSQMPFASSSSSLPSTSNLSSSAANTIFESPIDKFNRIKHEINHFQSDLSSLISSHPVSASEDGGVSELAALLSNELGQLDQQLNAVMNDKKLRALLVSEGDLLDELANTTDVGETQIPSINKLIQELQQGNKRATPSESKQPPSSAPSSSSASSSTSSSSSSSSLHAGVVSQLDRRIAALERTIGLPLGLGLAASASKTSVTAEMKDKDGKKLAASTSGTLNNGSVYSNQVSVYPDIQSGLFSLHRKLSLLDAGKLESMNKAIKALISDLEVLEQNKQTVSEHSAYSTGTGADSATGGAATSVHQQKIHELYEVLSRWDTWALQVPVLVSRFQSLRSVHEGAASAIQRLGKLEAAQNELVNTLNTDRNALEKLSQSWPTNLSTIEKNMSSLEERIAALTKKIGGK